MENEYEESDTLDPDEFDPKNILVRVDLMIPGVVIDWFDAAAKELGVTRKVMMVAFLCTAPQHRATLKTVKKK